MSVRITLLVLGLLCVHSIRAQGDGTDTDGTDTDGTDTDGTDTDGTDGTDTDGTDTDGTDTDGTDTDGTDTDTDGTDTDTDGTGTDNDDTGTDTDADAGTDTDEGTDDSDDTGESAGEDFDMDDYSFFDPVVECEENNATACESYTNSRCLPVNGSYQCGCDEGYKVDDDACIKDVYLNDVCAEGKTRCMNLNAACKEDGDGYGTTRCLCDDGYLSMEMNNETICAKILTRDKVTECETCENNDGVCYGLNATTKAGCKCPVSKKGEDCNVTLVTVTCDSSSFTKHVCYTPDHDGVDFNRTGEESSAMYASQKGNDEACKGKLLTEDSEFCKAGQVELVLQLTAGEMERCGTQEVKPDISTRRYDTTIVISKSGTSSGNSIAFLTYCSFTRQTSSKFGGVAVNVINGNNAGEHLKASLLFEVLNNVDRVIPDNIPVRWGDNVKYRITLTGDGTYSALFVDRCTASNMPIIPTKGAVTETIISGGCPAKLQSIITADTNWRIVPSDKASDMRVETGKFPMFKLSSGTTVFMHCTIKLCLTGNEEDCAPVNCTEHNGAGRRKRQAEQQNTNVEVVKGVEVYEPESESAMLIEKTDFAILLSILLILLVFFMALAVILYLKVRGRSHKVDDMALTDKPQRFALPRIRNPTMRM